MTESLPRYEQLYRKAAELQSKRAKLRQQAEITSSALDELHPYQPTLRSKSRSGSFTSFMRRNQAWQSRSKSRKMVRRISKEN
jgi:hypothetical protein